MSTISGTYTGLVVKNMQVQNLIEGTYVSAVIKSSKINKISATIVSLNIKNSVIDSSINGTAVSLYVANSYLKEIDATVENLVINKAELNTIKISNIQKMKITLQNNSIVHGDVVFSTRMGKVCIDDTSIIEGHVLNGAIIRENCSGSWE